MKPITKIQHPLSLNYYERNLIIVCILERFYGYLNSKKIQAYPKRKQNKLKNILASILRLEYDVKYSFICKTLKVTTYNTKTLKAFVFDNPIEYYEIHLLLKEYSAFKINIVFNN